MCLGKQRLPVQQEGVENCHPQQFYDAPIRDLARAQLVARSSDGDQLYTSGTTDSVGSNSHVACPSGCIAWELVRDGRGRDDAVPRACSSSVRPAGACGLSSLISTGDMTGANGYHAAARRGGRAAEGIRLLSG